MTAASPGLYEQVLVARGARDGGALIEGILPDAGAHGQRPARELRLRERSRRWNRKVECRLTRERLSCRRSFWEGPGRDGRRGCWRLGHADQSAGRVDADGRDSASMCAFAWPEPITPAFISTTRRWAFCAWPMRSGFSMSPICCR